MDLTALLGVLEGKLSKVADVSGREEYGLLHCILIPGTAPSAPAELYESFEWCS